MVQCHVLLKDNILHVNHIICLKLDWSIHINAIPYIIITIVSFCAFPAVHIEFIGQKYPGWQRPPVVIEGQRQSPSV